MSATREATNDDSTASRASRRRSRPARRRPDGPRLALAGLAAAAVVLLIVSNFLELYRVTTKPSGGGDLSTATLDSRTGFEQHSIALLLLALVAVPMVLGALRAARPAMAALGLIGIAVIVIALGVDLPNALDEGTYGEAYEAEAKPGPAFFVETLAGVLLLLAGGLMLFLTPAREQDERDAI